MARPVKESNEEYVRNLALIEKFDFRGLAFRFHFRTCPLCRRKMAEIIECYDREQTGKQPLFLSIGDRHSYQNVVVNHESP